MIRNNAINLYNVYIYREQVVNVNGCLQVHTIKNDDLTSRCFRYLKISYNRRLRPPCLR